VSLSFSFRFSLLVFLVSFPNTEKRNNEEMKREKYGRYPVECVGRRRTITTKSISHGICLKKEKKKGLQIGKENSQFGLESFISITQIVRELK
jgi:hypothetical protein